MVIGLFCPSIAMVNTEIHYTVAKTKSAKVEINKILTPPLSRWQKALAHAISNKFVLGMIFLEEKAKKWFLC